MQMTTPLRASAQQMPVAAMPADAQADMVEISVVVPVYNSAKTLRALLERLSKVLSGITERYELVLVEDGSPDDSWATLDALRAEFGQRLVAIQLMRNYGQHNALMCGLRHARGRFVVTMDDDLQNPPEEIPKLLTQIERSGADLVYGCPADRNHASWRNLGASVVWHFYRTVFKNPVTPTPFRIMRRELVQSVQFYDLNFTYLDGLLAWCTRRIEGVEVEHHARAEGRSGYSLSKLVALALNLYTNFSLLPLQLVSGLGLLASLSGFGVGAYYLIQSLTSSIAVPGYASTIVAILLLGGIQLLALGIIGEYLGRLHLNVNRKPQYLVRECLRPEEVGRG
ncbi:glycosyltransferase family 2 protein [Paucibacter sediminis]|uniref:Glycosyltransferase family 2 protein n=1 Tax=Paucibacter sediminis TaxID=3019553 RepID=A0AA95NFF8_9BURK|nr:glycosyltransferase family 2 protein [Paucibacter sp. S2-9]WIT11324.1 glycosyltransferase family 2 protein [Paucibacter sp. S2-9]